MKKVLFEIISERSSWHDSDFDEDIERDNMDRSYIDSIKINDKDPYSDCVNMLLESKDISGIEIDCYSQFLDPREKFEFDTYDEKECDAFREYLFNEYGVDQELLV